MTDWNQIVLRNVRNTSLPEIRYKDIGVNVVLGPWCKRPLSFGMPFLLDFTDGNPEEKRARMPGAGHCGDENPKLLVSYSACDESPWLLNRDCILELDGPEIDTVILATMNIGACFVDLTEVYYKLDGYNNDPLSHPDITRGTELPFYRNTKRTIDLRPFYSRDSHVDQWVSLLRRLRPDIPFGIRIPANYIERDCILAASCEVDFIIIDCPDAEGKDSKPTRVVPSLPALSRVSRILSRLSCGHISVITGVPSMDIGDYLKLFAMGSDLLMFSYPKDMEYGTGEKEGKGDADRAMSSALDKLKQAMYRCGCTSLNEAGMKHLLTGSSVISSFTDIAMLYEPDPVILPCFNIKRKSKVSEYLS